MPDLSTFGMRRRVPVVLQQERAECGLACLAMVAAYFGVPGGLQQLREEFRSAGHGATFQELVSVAQSLQLVVRPVRLSLADLARLKLPAVLHWRMNHFVVLISVKGKRCTIHDPAIGKRRIAAAELDESFTGVALEFTSRQATISREKKRRPGLLNIVGQLGNLKRYLAVMIFLLLVSQLLALVPAIATQIIIDEVVLGQDRAWLFRGLGGLAIIMLVTLTLEAMRGWIALYTGTRLASDSTVRVLDHLLRLPAEFIKRRHLGDLMSKLDSLTPVRSAVTTQGINIIVQGVVLVTTLTIMFLYSRWLTMVSIAGLAATLGVTLALLPLSRRQSQQLLVHRASQETSLVETLRAYDTVQGLGLGAARRLHWQHSFFAAVSTTVSQGKLAIWRNAASGLINSAEQLVFLAAGVAGILSKDITLGVLFAFMGLRGRVANAAVTVVELTQQLALLKVHIERLSDILCATPLAESPPGAVRANVRGTVQARNLCFSYGDGTSVLDGLTVDIESGTHVVITGPSGCGKTTLLKILAGHLPASGGVVMIDGLELGLWNRRTLTGQSATVLQNDQLFQGTIAENISAFSALPDLAWVRAAAIQAEIWTDIQNLPMRTETLIGDSGAGLSGGQIQRLTLARALYRQPRLLFLDEATSQLDVATEKRVLQNIAARSMTVVSVAHRPDAIALADREISLQPTPDRDRLTKSNISR